MVGMKRWVNHAQLIIHRNTQADKRDRLATNIQHQRRGNIGENKGKKKPDKNPKP